MRVIEPISGEISISRYELISDNKGKVVGIQSLGAEAIRDDQSRSAARNLAFCSRAVAVAMQAGAAAKKSKPTSSVATSADQGTDPLKTSCIHGSGGREFP